uniref:EF-hand domain-containing protein n=1 Tax=Photinus pyralis TaxID=7054 RepID=A0A1Y1NB82_PHOPY
MLNRGSAAKKDEFLNHHLPHEDEERLEKVFANLDRDGNGKIDIHDLSVELKKLGVHHHYAEKFIQQSDKTQSGDVSLADFILYVKEHEKNLRLHFSHLDKNKDGKIDLDELIRAFQELGVPLERQEATNLLQRYLYFDGPGRQPQHQLR